MWHCQFHFDCHLHFWIRIVKIYQNTVLLVWWNVVHHKIDLGSAGCDPGGAGGVLAALRAWGATPSPQFYLTV